MAEVGTSENSRDKHLLGPETKTTNKKTHKQNFHGTVPGLSCWDCPGLFLRFPRKFVDVFPFSSKRAVTHKQI